eukprot:TRINITY_DN8503_c0_g1_i1.p1 TRINITY_DN8503_c0_g1~~TRINITY_DN8503_c0_g1_i1.p1  ORF type:complete len:420 (+),score=38.47 TRINITY_DN8503_c0_g1_i1:28-1260(+)
MFDEDSDAPKGWRELRPAQMTASVHFGAFVPEDDEDHTAAGSSFRQASSPMMGSVVESDAPFLRSRSGHMLNRLAQRGDERDTSSVTRTRSGRLLFREDSDGFGRQRSFSCPPSAGFSPLVGSWADEVDRAYQCDELTMSPCAPSSEPQKQRQLEDEQLLTNYVIGFVQSPLINPFNGSVSSERLQSATRLTHTELYKSVVGAQYDNRWHKFIQAHADQFVLFVLPDGKWRIRLSSNANWEEGDKLETDEHTQKDQRIMGALRRFLLAQPSGPHCQVDDFMAFYTDQIMPFDSLAPPIPARGDFVRLVKRHKAEFAYDKDHFTIYLDDGTGVPGAAGNANAGSTTPEAPSSPASNAGGLANRNSSPSATDRQERNGEKSGVQWPRRGRGAFHGRRGGHRDRGAGGSTPNS